MADLTSCYFCGTVGDLDEYPVIPKALYPPADAQRTVALCPTCRQKLGEVMEPVVEFMDAPSRTGNGTAESGRRDGVEASAVDQREPADEGSAAESTETGEGKSLDDLVEEESASSVYTESRGAGYRWEPGEEERGVDADLPEGSRKVARLLRNRSFPVERAAVEDLAASAYDLDADDCRDIVDALIADGYLVERGDVLERPG